MNYKSQLDENNKKIRKHFCDTNNDRHRQRQTPTTTDTNNDRHQQRQTPTTTDTNNDRHRRRKC